MKILEVKDLCKNYGKGSTLVKALDDVSFSVEEGEFDSKEFNKNMKTVLKAAKHIMTSNPNSGISLSVEN